MVVCFALKTDPPQPEPPRTGEANPQSAPSFRREADREQLWHESSRAFLEPRDRSELNRLGLQHGSLGGRGGDICGEGCKHAEGSGHQCYREDDPEDLTAQHRVSSVPFVSPPRIRVARKRRCEGGHIPNVILDTRSGGGHGPGDALTSAFTSPTSQPRRRPPPTSRR